MKYYLIKEENYNPEAEKGKKFTYSSITEVDDFTRSKEIMIYDEIKNKCWYSFLYEENPKLKRVLKSDIKEMLENVEINDENQENFGEVSKEIFLKVLKNMSKKKNYLIPILKKINKIIKS